jgi:hypothetical protein
MKYIHTIKSRAYNVPGWNTNIEVSGKPCVSILNNRSFSFWYAKEAKLCYSIWNSNPVVTPSETTHKGQPHVILSLIYGITGRVNSIYKF